MKKLFLSVLALLAFNGAAQAISTPGEWNYIPYSSYTEVSTLGPILFSSAVVQIVGVTISSPAANSSVTFFRSTSPVFTQDITTQASITTDYLVSNAGPTYLDFFDMRNTSFTYINKIGTAKLIIWIHCPRGKIGSDGRVSGFCPGLPASGQWNKRIEPETP